MVDLYQVRRVLVAGLMFVGFGQLRGRDLVWSAVDDDSGVAANTSAAENWNPAYAPQDGDVLVFPDPVAKRMVNFDNGGLDLGGITIRNGYYSIGGVEISAREWKFNQFGGAVIQAACGVERADVSIVCSDEYSTAYLLGGMHFGGGNRTATISGSGRVLVGEITGMGGGAIVKNGTGALEIAGRIFPGAPNITVNGGHLEAYSKEWNAAHQITITANGTLRGSGHFGTVVSAGKIAPSYRDWKTLPGYIHFNGEVRAPEGAGSVVEMDLFPDGRSDRLICKSVGDFGQMNLSLVSSEGFSLAMGQSVMLVEVPPGGHALVPFKNLGDGGKLYHAGAVYEASYAGGASGKSLLITRVLVLPPKMTISPNVAAGTVTLELDGPTGMPVEVRSSTNLESWAYVRRVRLDANGKASVTVRLLEGSRFFRGTVLME